MRVKANRGPASARAAARFARLDRALRDEVVRSYRESMGEPGPFHELLWGELRSYGLDDEEIDALFVMLGRLAVQ